MRRSHHSNVCRTFKLNVYTISNIYFQGLSRLILIDLSENLIRSLEFNDFDMILNIESIFLRANRIQSINNDSLSNLKRLTLLDLASNRIKNFNITNTTLRYLDLSLNSLTSNEEAIEVANNLNRLNLTKSNSN